jgi:hypothetical protein
MVLEKGKEMIFLFGLMTFRIIDEETGVSLIDNDVFDPSSSYFITIDIEPIVTQTVCFQILLMNASDVAKKRDAFRLSQLFLTRYIEVLSEKIVKNKIVDNIIETLKEIYTSLLDSIDEYLSTRIISKTEFDQLLNKFEAHFS